MVIAPPPRRVSLALLPKPLGRPPRHPALCGGHVEPQPPHFVHIGSGAVFRGLAEGAEMGLGVAQGKTSTAAECTGLGLIVANLTQYPG
jgi:hypothetical protein